MTTSKKKSKLGNNPLAAAPSPVATGIFSPTAPATDSPETDDLSPESPEITEATTRKQSPESGLKGADSGAKKKESRKNKKETIFLDPAITAEDKDRVNLRLPVELNDWLDDLLKQGKRKHGRKIAKEIWMQAALELLRAMPLDLTEVASDDDLREVLKSLESRIKAL